MPARMPKKSVASTRSAQPGLFEHAIPAIKVATAVKSKAKRATSSTGAQREDANSMAARQREISISEFFTKNRHLLGFDNPQKGLLTAIKEAVDNSLDACEEAGILPELIFEIHRVGGGAFRIPVEVNAPGLVR